MAMLSNKFLSMYPRTPSGATSLLDLMTEPSHRIAGNMLAVGFEADPAVVRAYVPEPLELDGSGLIFLVTFDAWVFSERNSTEFVSPERVNFTESFFWIPCDFEGERLHYMLYSWVNRDWLAYLGRQVGMPHKLAKVQLTNFHPSDPVYNGPAEGVRVCASVENVGLVHRTHVDLKRIYEPEELPFRMPRGGPGPRYVGHRYVYDVVEDRPALNDLVVHWGDDRTVGEIWGGEASLTFYEAENEEVLPFQPRRMVGGWWYTVRFDHATSPPKIIHRFGN